MKRMKDLVLVAKGTNEENEFIIPLNEPLKDGVYLLNITSEGNSAVCIMMVNATYNYSSYFYETSNDGIATIKYIRESGEFLAEAGGGVLDDGFTMEIYKII